MVASVGSDEQGNGKVVVYDRMANLVSKLTEMEAFVSMVNTGSRE